MQRLYEDRKANMCVRATLSLHHHTCCLFSISDFQLPGGSPTTQTKPTQAATEAALSCLSPQSAVLEKKKTK